MAGAPKTQLQLEIAHVLFIDIVGYSKLLISEQSDLLEKLKAMVRRSEEVRTAEAEGKLIRLPTGDGMALVFRNSPEAPVQCALELARAVKQHPELLLRMGIHSGPINEVSDVNDRANVTGAGINMAQRIMDCGDAGHILLSQHVADDLEQYGQWRPLLHDLGQCEVKHRVRLHVVNLYDGEVGNPAVPDKFRTAKPSAEAISIPSAKSPAVRWGPIVVGATLLALGTVAFLWWQRSSSGSATAAKPAPTAAVPALPAIPEKSVAVLPFENLSEEKANAFFADGVQDEILTDLSKIADLKVISRSSVMHYKSGVERNLRQIGEQLGVAHVLEGSVQRAHNRIRVNAQLIDARTDAHLWAQTYDRNLEDVFAIQSEIAKAIADQLQAKLSPNEKSAIERPPTTDVAAFDFYSRAKTLRLNISFTSLRKDNLLQAIDLLNQAVARDPNFLLAYCGLADGHDQLYFLGMDRTPARLAAGEAAVAAALRLGPHAGETHLALAQHRYRGYRDYNGARAELAIAQRTLPNDPAIVEFSGFIDRRQGRWEESTRELERTTELDPRNLRAFQQIALNWQQLRRYDQMAAVLDRAVAIAPESVESRIARAQVELHWHADTRPLHAEIAAILAANPSAASIVAENWMNLAVCERDPAAASQALTALSDNTFGEATVAFSPKFGEGLIALMRCDAAAARVAFTAARTQQDVVVRAQPDYGPALCVLGVIDAALGRKEEAVREGKRAIELMPVSRDAVTGAELSAFYAAICAWAGEKDLAIAQLEIVTRIPCYLSYGQLRLQPYWDPLRGDPRFEKIVASLAPKRTN
ncbi:MAG: adenylate/guanylate cyclase domain-containing protein [Chthoniobacterales bacterium]